MKKRVGSLNGLGIGVTIVLALIMIIVQFTKTPTEPFHMRIITGLVGCLIVMLGAGLIILALFFVFYAAQKVSDELFVHEEEGENRQEKELIDVLFQEHSNAIVVIAVVASYITVLLLNK